MSVGRLSFNVPFFEEAAKLIRNRFASDPCTWRRTLVLAPSIRTCSSLRSALIASMPWPSFCPRIISFKNVPEHVGMSAPESMPSAQQASLLYALLNKTSSPMKQLDQAKSWQRQMDELARHASIILDEVRFERLFRPLWPGEWSDRLYEIYMQSAPMKLRQQTETLWEFWENEPPTYPVVVVGSTGSTVVSRGWRDWAGQYLQGLVIEREGEDNIPEHVRLVQAVHAHQAAQWMAEDIAQHAVSNDCLALVAHQPADVLNHHLATKGLAVTYGEFVPFRSTPVGQFWLCLMRLLAEEQPSTLLFWECLKRVGGSSLVLVEAELRCRQENMLMDSAYEDVWQHVINRPYAASLSDWWQWIKSFVGQLQKLFPHPILEDMLSWPDELSIEDVQDVPCILLPQLEAWWPIPEYQVQYDTDPRVLGVGPWEARGMSCDRVWVYGLNEGTWPGQPDIEPWLSTLDREEFNLPDAQHFARLAYHDLMCTLGSAQHVTWVTLADQPLSRWLVGCSVEVLMNPVQPSLMQHELPVGIMDKAIHTISVTEADCLMRDPYAYYVRAVLKLRELERLPQLLRQERTAREKGLAFHRVMQLWATYGNTQRWQNVLNEQDIAEFFWRRQLELCLPQIELGQEMLCEVSYKLMLDDVRLTGRLDRVDLDPCVVVNYKTGTLPSVEDIANGQAPQLALETLLASHHLKKVEGISHLVALKHSPEVRQWKWDESELCKVRTAFLDWLKSVTAYPAYGSIGMEHIERTFMWC